MAAVKAERMLPGEFPFDLGLDIYGETFGQDQQQHINIVEPLLSIMVPSLDFDDPLYTMLEDIDLQQHAPFPISTPSPALSSCSSPPNPPTRSNTPPSSSGQTTPSNPSSPRMKKSRASSGANGGRPQKCPRHKRPSHINAEHRRRNKIQNGFEDLKKLIPSIAEMPANSAKDSKASMLNKTSEHIRQLTTESNNLQKEADGLRKEMESLNAEVNATFGQLPATGLEPPKPTNHARLDQLYSDYMGARVLQNWKFFIFSMMATRLFKSYNQTVESATTETFVSSIKTWTEKSCSLVELRPVMLQTLRELSKNTSVMSKPEKLKEEVITLAMEDALGVDLKRAPTPT